MSDFMSFEGIVYKYFGNGVVIYNTAEIGLNEIKIPKTVYGKPVVGVAQTAFMLEDSLREIQLPESIMFIEKNAFDSCQKLEKVVLYPVENFEQKVVLKIEEYAFQKCPQLKELQGQRSIVELETGAFAECPMLQKFNCPIQILNAEVFKGNKLLSDLSFHTFAEVNQYALCETNISTLTIPLEADIDREVLKHIKTNNIKIRCRTDSRLINLAFDGYWIEVFEEK